MLFPFTNSRVDISAFNIYCGQSSFSITARYPDWVNEIMGEALWREICLIVNKPKRNVKLKSVTGQVHCKREKCCAYEPFTEDNQNAYKTFRDLSETFSSKEKPLLSCTMPGQNLKKFTFLKDGFPDGHNNRFSFFGCVRSL